MKSILKSATLLFSIAIMGLAVQSCTSVKQIDKTSLTGYWALESLDGQKASEVFKGSIPSVSFDIENNTIFGNAGCNSYNGAFTLTESNEFSAPNLAATMMMCLDENKEPEFLKALGEKSVISVSNNNLIFKSGDKIILQFVKGETPKTTGEIQTVNAENLSGEWALTKMSGKTASEIFTDKVPTIKFDTDGTVNGNAGCNNYRSSFKLEENTLTFGPIMSTKMACPSLSGETEFTKILSSPVTVTINDNELVLFQNGEEVMALAKTAD